MTELEQKQQVIQDLLGQKGLDALVLRRASSFAWATHGAASYVNTATAEGEATLVITPAGRYLVTNNIEATRLEREEKLAEQGWQFKVSPWYEAHDTVAELTRGLKVGADVPYPGATDLAGQMARLRATLTPAEEDRFRTLGRLCAAAMDDTIRAVQPGQTEYEIAARLARETQGRGAQPIVNLIATDARIFSFRHPLPTGKKLERYAMLVLCGRRQGLVCSITRLVHFGPIPADVQRKAEAVARIDAAFFAATRPGKTLGQVFEQATAAYAQTGFPDEWQLHHQGGPAGYEPREYIATPGSTDLVRVGQAYAWNPSITGAKSEDTILVGQDRNEVLTDIPGWPIFEINVNGQILERPAIREV